MIDNIVDKTFIINMDSDTDRLEKITAELLRVGLSNYERFSAITLNPVDITNGTIANSEYKHMTCPSSMRYRKYNYFAPCVGIKRSQVQILRIAKERGYKRILILEDDTALHSSINKILTQSIDQLQEEPWDVLQLVGNHLNQIEVTGRNVIRITGSLSAVATIFNHTVFDDIIENVAPSGLEIDMFYSKHIHSKYDCFCTRPHLAWNRPCFSNILQQHRSYNLLTMDPLEVFHTNTITGKLNGDVYYSLDPMRREYLATKFKDTIFAQKV